MLFGQETRLPCVLQFSFKPSENWMVGDEYVENLPKKLNSIHENARSSIQIGSDKMKERYYNILHQHPSWRTSTRKFSLAISSLKRSRLVSAAWEGPYHTVIVHTNRHHLPTSRHFIQEGGKHTLLSFRSNKGAFPKFRMNTLWPIVSQKVQKCLEV